MKDATYLLLVLQCILSDLSNTRACHLRLPTLGNCALLTTMASATYISASSASPSFAVQPTAEMDADSPLLRFVPYTYAAFSFVGSLLSFSLTLIRLVLSPLPVLLYIIAPITTFVEVATTLFVVLPYKTFLYLAEALYPLYVLVGVACITGCLFGYGGLRIVRTLVNSFVGPPVPQSNIVEMLKKDMKARGRQQVKFEE